MPIQSAALDGLNVEKIYVEVDVTFGLKNVQIVGLPDRAVRESCGRVEAAIKASGFPFPRYRTTINLAPGHLKKHGPVYDLPIAAGILQIQGVVPLPEGVLIVGEVGLDGSVRHVDGVLPIAIQAKQWGYKEFIVPMCDAREAAVVRGITVLGVSHIKDLVAHLNGDVLLQPTPATDLHQPSTESSLHDFCYVKGQARAKRALEISAAGAHNVLLSGPPGSGKTMLARSLPTILPELTEQEVLEITRIHSVCGTLRGQPLVSQRPFQSPHHTTSGVALIGGGAQPKPGQVSLAHRGVLFLDEFPEFSKQALENLRQPMEDGMVTVSRAAGTATFPAQFMLVAAMNPCPCGYASDPFHDCVCAPNQIIRYQKKLSGPLLDRIDLHLEVPKIPIEELATEGEEERSAHVRQRVQAARDIQSERFQGTDLFANADMRSKDIRGFCPMDTEAKAILSAAATALHVSARTYVRMVKVARTIADLDASSLILSTHMSEALQFRERITRT